MLTEPSRGGWHFSWTGDPDDPRVIGSRDELVERVRGSVAGRASGNAAGRRAGAAAAVGSEGGSQGAADAGAHRTARAVLQPRRGREASAVDAEPLSCCGGR